MPNNTDMQNFKLANLEDKTLIQFKSLEDKLKTETGKDFILVAWEKTK